MKNLYLVRGVSGAGKSTFVASVACESDVVVANDDFMVDDSGGYSFDRKRLEEVTKKCQEVVGQAMKEEVERIFVHNTLTTEKETEPYFTLAKTHGYQIFSIIIENRHGNIDVHNVPEDTRKKQKARFDIKLGISPT